MISNIDRISETSQTSKIKIESMIELVSACMQDFQSCNQHKIYKEDQFKQDITHLISDLVNPKHHGSIISVSEKRHSRMDALDDVNIATKYSTIQLKYLKKCKVSQNEFGAFYTPNDVIANVFSSCIEIWGIGSQTLKNKSILDPTMGAGDWLLHIFDYIILNCNINKLAQKIKILRNSIFGFDIDPVAVLTTRLIFWRKLNYDSSAVDILRKNFTCQDTLKFFSSNQIESSKNYDIIIGNPPYVVQNLRNIDCETNKTNNIYAPITEAATSLLNPGGHICFVLPLSFVCSKKIQDLRMFCERNYSEINYSSYSIRPMKIFEGVDQRICIFIGTKKKNINQECKIFSSGGYYMWRDRSELQKRLSELSNKIEVNDILQKNTTSWPKIENTIEKNILFKLGKNSSKNGTILDLVSKQKTDYPIYFYGNARYFIKALNYKPYYKNELNYMKDNSELKTIYVNSKESQYLLIGIMNSKLYFWLWSVYSDCFHVDQKLLGLLSQNFSFHKIQKTTEHLMKEMKKNSFTRKHGQNYITEFDIRACLNSISKIDSNLNSALGLTDSEALFLRDYLNDVRKSLNIEAAA